MTCLIFLYRIKLCYKHSSVLITNTDFICNRKLKQKMSSPFFQLKALSLFVGSLKNKFFVVFLKQTNKQKTANQVILSDINLTLMD